MIEIKKYRLSELGKFIASDHYKSLSNKPISKQRALSYLNNPNANEQMNVLYMAYEEGQMVGFRTIFSDKVTLNGSRYDFGWFNGSWVLSSFRRKGIASMLLEAVVEDWGDRLFATNFAPVSLKVYYNSGHFSLLKEMEGVRFYFRFNLHELLAPKHKIFKKAAPLIRIFDKFLNLLLDLGRFRSTQLSNEYKVEIIDRADEEAQDLIEKTKLPHEISQRDIKALNWIIEYPWITQASSKAELDDSYIFSSVKRRFENIRVKIRSQSGELEGWVMLNIIDNKLTIPYCYCQPGCGQFIISYIFSIALEKRINMLTVYNSSLVKDIKNGPYLFKKKIINPYLVSKEFLERLDTFPEVTPQDGEGDCAFV